MHRSRLEIAIVVAITLVGLLLRLRSIGNSLFGDELSTYSIVTDHSIANILTTLDGHSVDLTPPLYFLLAWVAERLGSSPELLRSFALLAGAATIPLTYLLGLRTVGRAAALSGALLVALSPFLIFYSTEARAYAVVMSLVLASTLALLEAIKSNHLRWWVAYAVLGCAAMYSHYTAVFALAIQLLWALFVHPGRMRGLIGANVASAIGFAAWIPALVKNTSSSGTRVFEIVDPFGLRAVARDLLHAAIGHPYLRLSSEPGTVAIALILAGVASAGLVGALGNRRDGAGRVSIDASSPAWLPLLIALALPMGLAFYSTFRTSVWDQRNLIVSWPYAALTLGALLVVPKRPWRLVTVGLVLAGFAIGALKLLTPEYERPDYAAAAQFVLSRGGAGDPVTIVQAPTPGPYSAMDAAFAFAGDPGRPLLRTGAAPLRAVQRAAPYALLPSTPAATLAAQTSSTAGNGEVFVVAPGVALVANLLRSRVVDDRAVLGPVFGTGTSGALFGTVFTPLSAYMRAISRRFVPDATKRLPGFLRLSVYVFKRR